MTLSLPGMALEANAVLFGRLLRRAGLPTGPDDTRLFLTALGAVGLDDAGTVRAAGRAVFVHRREDLDLFDRAFALFWRRHGRPTPAAPALPRIRHKELPPPTFPVEPDPCPRRAGRARFAVDRIPALASSTERLRSADFALLSPAEAHEALALLAALRPALPLRPSRRWRPSRGGGRPALRAVLRDAMRTEGVPFRWRWLDHPERPRPVVLILDVSGSMERYSRLLLRFAHALAQSGAPLEVFAFGTRLTRITRELRVRDSNEALRRVGRVVVDWNGGTRIGESVWELNRRWVRRAIRSGAVVLLASDGWERGDPRLLAREMAMLRRSCYRLLWLDPLAARPGFRPEVAGLRAALPHVDEFVPCASVEALVGLAGRLRGKRQEAGGRRPPPTESDRCESCLLSTSA